MKKLKLIAALMLSVIAFSISANSQYKFAANNDKISSPDKYLSKELVDTRTVRKFIKEFPGITDDTWQKIKTGFVVTFTSNGIQKRVFFNKSGNRESIISYYTEKDMPAEVRHQIKSTYYDFAISLVREVSTNSSRAYLVTIEDKTTWKVIRIVEGAMDVWESHQKS